MNGSGKVLIAQERQAPNHVFVFQKKMPCKYLYVAEVRSAHSESFRAPSTFLVKMMAGSGQKVCFFIINIFFKKANKQTNKQLFSHPLLVVFVCNSHTSSKTSPFSYFSVRLVTLVTEKFYNTFVLTLVMLKCWKSCVHQWTRPAPSNRKKLLWISSESVVFQKVLSEKSVSSMQEIFSRGKFFLILELGRVITRQRLISLVMQSIVFSKLHLE